MPNEKQRFDRYNVVKLEGLKSSISGNKAPLQLVTLGPAGCGFYGFEKFIHLLPVKRVTCQFQLDEEKPIEIQGNLVEAKETQVNNKTVIFYMIDFIVSHRSLIEPLILKLEDFERLGKVVGI